jgi:hypothetical protein
MNLGLLIAPEHAIDPLHFLRLEQGIGNRDGA